MSSVRRAPARANQGAGTTGEREVLPHTRLVAWQWEATTIPIPESEWGRLAERISDALSEVHRTTVLPGVEITLGDSASSILRINHGGPEEAFLLEVRRTGLLYRHQPVTGARMGGDGPGRHIRVVAKPLLARAVLDPQIRERLLSAACGYELEAIVPGDEAHANSQLALAKLVHGLQSRPWEQHLPDQPRATLASSARSAVRGRPGAAAKRSAPSVDARSAGRRRASRPMERLDVKWATSATLVGEDCSLWFKVECPANAGYRQLDTTVVAQSAPGALPSPAWGAKVVAFHDAVWPTAVSMIRWLFDVEG